MKTRATIIRTLPLLVIIFILLLPLAQADSSDLVKGFAKYQAGRVENIVLDKFIYDLANEKFLKQFFPETSGSINEYDGISGKRLIPLLSFYVKKDLKTLKDLADCVENKIWIPIKEIKKKVLASGGNDEIANAFDALDWMMVFKTNSAFDTRIFLNKASCEEQDETIATVARNFSNAELFKGIYKQLKDGAGKVEKIKEKIDDKIEILDVNSQEDGPAEHRNYRDINNGLMKVSRDVIKVDIEDNSEEGIKEKIKSKFAEIDYVARIDELLEKHIKQKENIVGVSSNKELAKGVDFSGFMSAIHSIKQLKDSDTNGDSTNYAIYVHQLSVALNALGLQVDDRAGFQKFKSSSLFLASLAEAVENSSNGGADAVAGVIDDFVNEDVAYKNKRNSVALYTRKVNDKNLRCSTFVFCRNTWFLGSYYGVSLGDLDENADGSKQRVYRAFGPIGIEFKLFSGPIFGMDSTVTIMAAPIDIGVYVTDELKGDEYDVDIEDITAPSYFFSFSSNSSPISIQVGYQDEIPVTVNKTEDMYFISLTFDLPLVTLW